VSDLQNLRKNVALPSTRLVDPSLRLQRRSDTSSRLRLHSWLDRPPIPVTFVGQQVVDRIE
jgi:hypothetical protein